MTEGQPFPDLAGEVASAVRHVDDPSRVLGIILHGSRATGETDEASDIDLVVIDTSANAAQHATFLGSLAVDVFCGPISVLRKKLQANDAVNNNFLLNSLKSGIVQLDRDGSARSLVAEAKVIWERGPTAMPPEEYSQTRSALHRALQTARTRSARYLASPEAAFFARYSADQVATRSVYLYHRVRRRWTNGLPQLLRRVRVEDPRLYRLWRQYVEAVSQDQRLAAAAELVNAAFDTA